jgi:hypothetical protein
LLDSQRTPPHQETETEKLLCKSHIFVTTRKEWWFVRYLLTGLQKQRLHKATGSDREAQPTSSDHLTRRDLAMFCENGAGVLSLLRPRHIQGGTNYSSTKGTLSPLLLKSISVSQLHTMWVHVAGK